MIGKVAFLRGVNVGGNGLIRMSELAALCANLGFKEVRTYIQSGNVIFKSKASEEELIDQLENALFKKMSTPISVIIRTTGELDQILKSCPFPNAEPAKVGVILLKELAQKNFPSEVSSTTGEEVIVGKREIYIHYPNGMGRSKLKLPPQAKQGTVRNINTLQKIWALC